MQISQARSFLGSSYYVFITLVLMESLRMINSVGAFGVLAVMAYDLDIGIDSAQVLMETPFLLGLVLGQLFVGMLSDRYGRMTTFIQLLNIYVIVSLLSLIFKNPAFLIVFRLMTGFTGAVSEVTVRAILSDYCDFKLSARIFSKVSGLSAILVGISPLIFGYMSQSFGWRSFFIINAIICCSVSIIAMYLVRLFDNKAQPRALSLSHFYNNLRYTLASLSYFKLCSVFLLSAIIMQFSFSILPMMVIDHFHLSSRTLSLIIGILSGLVFWASSLTNSWLLQRYSMIAITRVAFIATWLCSIVHLAIFFIGHYELQLTLYLADFYIGIFAENIIFINLFMLATHCSNKRSGAGFITALTISLFTLGMVFASLFGSFVDLKIISVAYILYALFVSVSLAFFLYLAPTFPKPGASE